MEVKVHFLEPRPEVYKSFMRFLIDWLESQENILLKRISVEACQVVLLLETENQIAFMEEGDLNRFKNVLKVLKNLKKRIVLFSMNTKEDVADAFPGLIDFFIDGRSKPSQQAEALAGFLRAHFE